MKKNINVFANNFKEIVIKEDEKTIKGFCPYCNSTIFSEHKDKPFVGEFNYCYACGVSLKTYPRKEEEYEC